MKVKLTQPHTHAMRHYEPGETIEVSAVEAHWLGEHNLIDKPGRDTTHDVTASTKRGKRRYHDDRDTREENDQ